MKTHTRDFGIPQNVTDRDVLAVQNLIEAAKETQFFKYRRERNVTGPPPKFSREKFWHALILCLLTTRQKSAKGTPVDRFLNTKPFLLNLETCCKQGSCKRFVLKALNEFGGIRFGDTIAARTSKNLKWLRNHWNEVEDQFHRLCHPRSHGPEPNHRESEREAAHWADEAFIGLGPKQSRNLWQYLGLTRYEIPLDSRVIGWVNTNLSFEVKEKRLGSLRYYEAVLDHLQVICEKAGLLPQDLDAAAFGYESTGDGRFRKTTDSGFVNVNAQITVRNTGAPGTDHNQYAYQLACSLCGHVYGANGSDIHDRKCPHCQDGLPGLPL